VASEFPSRTKEYRSKYQKQYRLDTASKYRHLSRRNTWRKAGIDPDEAEQVLRNHDGHCAICGTDQPLGRFGTWGIDHDHATGKIRGVLCHHCNVGLGHFKDDVHLLQRALEYVSSTLTSCS
jgi:hypothetical protein